MEQAKVQTYLQRIIKPEEFLIDSNVKRWDIFEEDRKRIEKSPWMSADVTTESPFVDKPGEKSLKTGWFLSFSRRFRLLPGLEQLDSN